MFVKIGGIKKLCPIVIELPPLLAKISGQPKAITINRQSIGGVVVYSFDY
jgi:hypothetical protein